MRRRRAPSPPCGITKIPGARSRFPSLAHFLPPAPSLPRIRESRGIRNSRTSSLGEGPWKLPQIQVALAEFVPIVDAWSCVLSTPGFRAGVGDDGPCHGASASAAWLAEQLAGRCIVVCAVHWFVLPVCHGNSPLGAGWWEREGSSDLQTKVAPESNKPLLPWTSTASFSSGWSCDVKSSCSAFISAIQEFCFRRCRAAGRAKCRSFACGFASSTTGIQERAR